MRVGLALPAYDIETGRAVSVPELAEMAVRAEELGFDSAWLMDHHFIERDGRRLGGFEPLTALAYLAAGTSRLRLGVFVLSVTFRGAGQLARELATLESAAPGRTIIGLGCGSFPLEHEAFGVSYDYRVSKFEETVRSLPGLLGGERVSSPGRFVKLEDASITTEGRVPPIWAAAFGPRMIELTVRHTNGWTGGWDGPDPSRFAEQVEAVKEFRARAGLGAGDFDFVAALLVVAGDVADTQVIRRAERLAPAEAAIRQRVTFGTAEDVAGTLGAYQAAGATYAIIAPTPRQFALFEPQRIEEIGRSLELARGAENV
jgi:alkanesulfonate monooxygenase SsuD/methylene tetrahydromethanopterin reductase-like flavin-dependent oxidoreductase (luciferase family)